MAAPLTRTKKVKNLTPEEYKACYSLNLRDGGLMRTELMVSRHLRRDDSYATLRFNRDGTLAAWALVFPCEYNGSYYDAYFYVRKRLRRHGLGKHLVQHVNKHFGQVRVYPHENVSNKFFNYVYEKKYNVDIQPDYF